MLNAFENRTSNVQPSNALWLLSSVIKKFSFLSDFQKEVFFFFLISIIKKKMPVFFYNTLELGQLALFFPQEVAEHRVPCIYS